MFAVVVSVVSKGDLVQVIVAEDLFTRLVDDPDKLLLKATYGGAKSWAGNEEAFRGLIMNYLFDGCPAAREFVKVWKLISPPHALPSNRRLTIFLESLAEASHLCTLPFCYSYFWL